MVTEALPGLGLKDEVDEILAFMSQYQEKIIELKY